ncbi:ABC transporter ATP-binding protein [Bacillus sp. FJAT-42376]|uniref:ATP-binding cassette domain-containing protein n=1 Tax=Bacillus sp. FJAT-42376 TaxID=2014076 RepID=UPI000F4EAB75|nr:ABC transporter ATP-binding protein [Bacillus sp. FJAT-42376]AZB42648.1 ABC transporter ATP-binding protein [Bacillus sp. FJAT-42376]
MNALKNLTSYCGSFKSGFYPLLLFTLLLSVTIPAGLLFLQMMIDKILLNEAPVFLSAVIMGMLTAVSCTAAVMQRKRADVLQMKIENELNRALYEQLNIRSVFTFDLVKMDKFMAAFHSDLLMIQQTLSKGIFGVLGFSVRFIISAAILLIYSAPLALCLIPFLVISGALIVRRSAIPSASASEWMRQPFLRLDKNHQPRLFSGRTLKAVVLIWCVFISGCAVFIRASGGLTAGELAASLCMLWLIAMPLLFTKSGVARMADAGIAARRVLSVLEPAEDLVFIKGRGQLKLDRVSFAYSEKEVLSGVCIEGVSGKTIGIVGERGAGKTSLAHIISGFYKPSSGTVTIDGTDIYRDPLGSAAAVVFEHSSFRTASVKANLAFGLTETPMSEIIHAAKMAQVHNFIMELPEQYNTILDRSVHLSRDCCQRLAIARALCLNPDVLVLDDAASCIDLAAFRRIFEAIKERKGRRTLIILSDSPESVCLADEIIVLCDGAVSERGTHNDLLQKGGVYRRMYDRCGSAPAYPLQ